MNDIQANKAIVLDYLDLLSRNRHADAFELLSDELRWWVPDTLPGSGFITKKAIYDKLRKVADSWNSPIRFAIEYITAEEDRVAVLMTSEATKPDGNPYRQVYHHLFIVRDGRIVEGRPFLDTLEFAREVHGAAVVYPNR